MDLVCSKAPLFPTIAPQQFPSFLPAWELTPNCNRCPPGVPHLWMTAHTYFFPATFNFNMLYSICFFVLDANHITFLLLTHSWGGAHIVIIPPSFLIAHIINNYILSHLVQTSWAFLSSLHSTLFSNQSRFLGYSFSFKICVL